MTVKFGVTGSSPKTGYPHVADYRAGAVAPPPVYVWDWTSVRFSPFRNAMDESSLPPLNDCCWAEVGNMYVQMAAQGGSSGFVPNDDDIVAGYSAACGYDPNNAATDLGCDITRVEQYMAATGVRGHRIDAYAIVDFTDLTELKLAMVWFGGLKIGIRIPASLDFLNTDIWDAQKSGDGSIQHCIRAIGYDQLYLYCVSWGRIIKLTWAFIQQNLFEAIAAVSLDMLDAHGNYNGLDLAQLSADIKALTPSAITAEKNSVLNWLTGQQQSTRVAVYAGAGIVAMALVWLALKLAGVL